MWVIKHWFALANKRDPFYVLYRWIKKRCDCKNNISYKNYWGRWIKCEWNTFEEFKNDMYESYLEHINKYWRLNTSIDRIDNDRNYCKENCKWATRREQMNNRRNTLFTVVNWIRYTAKDLSDMCWISVDWAEDRIQKYNDWRMCKEWLLFIGKQPTSNELNCKSYAVVDGKKYSLYDIVNMCWIRKDTAYLRIKKYNKWIMCKDALFKIWSNHERITTK